MIKKEIERKVCELVGVVNLKKMSGKTLFDNLYLGSAIEKIITALLEYLSVSGRV